MKNRRFALVAFLLVATLVMGVGFATITGQLNITGTAKYSSSSETASSVHSAIKFTKAEAGDNCTATITDTVNGDSADLTVTFNDETAAAETFTATATYTIAYESTDTTLSPVTFDAYNALNVTCDNNKFTVTYEWINGKNTVEPHATDNHDASIAQVRVTVTYTSTENETGVQNAIITIKLPYSTT